MITCTTLRPCLGLQPDQYFKAMSFLRSDKIKVGGPARLCRGLKKDRAWEIVLLHLESSIVHKTRSMHVCRLIRCARIALTVPIFRDIFHAQNESEMLRIRKMLRSATVVKMNMGRWRWSGSTPYPPWDAVQKCFLWSAEEWKAVRPALTKPLRTVHVELTDNKVVLLRNKGPRPQMRTTMI